MSNIAIVYALFPEVETAKTIARYIVSEGLAACANILAPCISIYEWDGTAQENEEAPVLFKTREDLAQALIARITELHSYDLPAILMWSAEASSAFSNWVRESTR
jgi:periplasmic divalent cation tolerance protein